MFVLHIGLKKSGSASIQTFLAANYDALRAMSIDYTTIGRGKRKAHHNLAHDAMTNAKFDASQGTLTELARAASDRAVSRVMVSSEMFEGCEPVAVSAVRSRLEAAGREYRIVLIIRDLLDLMPSSYAQKIRYGLNLFDFDEFFEERMKEARVDYFETASRWGDVFGWDALRIRPLDRRFQKNGDLIDDFLDAADVDLLDPRVQALERPGLVNAAAGWKVLEAVRGLHTGLHGLPDDHLLVRNRDAAGNRRQGRVIEEAARDIGDRLGWNADRGRYYTRAQAERVRETYAAAIAALNTRLPVALPEPSSLDERGFVERDFVPDVAHIPADELRTFYDALGELLVSTPKKTKTESKARSVPAPAVAIAVPSAKTAKQNRRKEGQAKAAKPKKLKSKPPAEAAPPQAISAAQEAREAARLARQAERTAQQAERRESRSSNKAAAQAEAAAARESREAARQARQAERSAKQLERRDAKPATNPETGDPSDAPADRAPA